MNYVYEEHKDLYEAAKQGNWKRDEEISMQIQENSVAHSCNHTKWEFVENLVGLMLPKALEKKDTRYGYTAIHTASMEGNSNVVKLMVKKNPCLTKIHDNYRRKPLHTAVKFVSEGQMEVVQYLYSATRYDNPTPFTGQRGVLVRRPFSFQSENKTTWWQSRLYPFLQVDTEALNDLDSRADLKNPRESSTVRRGAITKFISKYLITYLTQ
ncbi:hypothetical protein MKX01_039718, partial [Papaver californicum]